jgi:hypothetical protein
MGEGRVRLRLLHRHHSSNRAKRLRRSPVPDTGMGLPASIEKNRLEQRSTQDEGQNEA